MKDLWKQPRANLGDSYKSMLVEWRRGNTITRLEKPTRIDRARTLGYRAKQGFVMVRVRVKRGGKKNPSIKKGRDGGNLSSKITQAKNYKWIAEEKAQRRYPNLEVLNAYWVGQDEKSAWYEIIMVDVYHPQIINDKKVSWIVSNKHTKRAQRGLTSSGKKSRGLRNKGKGAEKVRPSLKANGGKLR